MAQPIQPISARIGPSTTRSSAPGGARSEAFGRAERHSRRVRRLKILLPVAALTIAAVFAAYSYRSTPVALDVQTESSTVSKKGELVMANPKLEGFTKDNKPYSMTAERAVQDVTKEGIITMFKINAKLPMDADGWAKVAAVNGTYDQVKNTLRLREAIDVVTDKGVEIALGGAFMDITRGSLKTNQPVDIKMGQSWLKSEALEVVESGKVIVFSKNVRMYIDPGTVKAAQNTEGGDENDAAN